MPRNARGKVTEAVTSPGVAPRLRAASRTLGSTARKASSLLRTVYEALT